MTSDETYLLLIGGLLCSSALGAWLCLVSVFLYYYECRLQRRCSSRVKSSFFSFHVNITVDVTARRLCASTTRVVIVKEEDGKKQRGQILLVSTEAPLTTTISIPEEI